MFFRWFCLLLCVSGAGLRADDDPKEIVRRALQANNHNRDLQRSYTHTERTEERTLDHAGKVTKVKSETWDVIPLQGAQFRRLTLRDDKSLSPAEERKQEEARKKQEAERTKRQELRERETPEQRQKRLDARDRREKQQKKDIDDIVAGFDLKLVGEEAVDGMPAWIIAGVPRKGYKFQSKEASAFLSKVQGRIWVTKGDYEAVRIDAETTDTISYGLFLARIYKGTRIQMDFMRVNNEVWVPKREKATISARVALVKGFHMEEESVYRDYKKFTADSRMVDVDPDK